MPRKVIPIEELLETIGSCEPSSDMIHCYELRRKLLSSRFFDETSQKTTHWDRVFSYTAPLIAGGMMVGVFILFASSPIEEEMDSPGISQMEVREVETEVVVSSEKQEEFLSDPSEPKVRLVDFGKESSQNTSSFIPLNYYQPIRMQ